MRGTGAQAHRRGLHCIAALLSVCLTAPVHGHEPGAAHYVGNEGVLVRHGTTAVLFDALFVDSLGNYVVPDARTRAAMDAGEAPFESVSAVFVSHVHADHFDATRTLAFLRARPSIAAFGPIALRDALEAAGADTSVLERVVAFGARPGSAPEARTRDRLLVEVVAVPHANPQRFPGLQNLAFRVVLEEALTITHLGDADTDPEAFAEEAEHWAARHTHAVFPPYWFQASGAGRRILETHFAADAVIGIHVPRDAGRDADGFRARLGGDAFVVPGEIRMLPHEPASEAP